MHFSLPSTIMYVRIVAASNGDFKIVISKDDCLARAFIFESAIEIIGFSRARLKDPRPVRKGHSGKFLCRRDII